MFRVFVRGQGSASSLDFTLYCTLLMKAMRNRGEYIQNLKTEEKKILLKKKKKANHKTKEIRDFYRTNAILQISLGVHRGDVESFLLKFTRVRFFF